MMEMEASEKRYAIFFVEGATEKTFYSLLIEFLSKGKDQEDLPIFRFVDLKGENHFAQKANAKALSLYLKNRPADHYDLFFCYDHDLFPDEHPFDWKKTKQELGKRNLEGHFISPIEQIEDWFFLDEEGLLKYLRLPHDFDLAPYKKLHSSGLRKLFWKQRKVYRKGEKAKPFLQALSFPILIEKIGEPLKPILHLFQGGLDKESILKSV